MICRISDLISPYDSMIPFHKTWQVLGKFSRHKIVKNREFFTTIAIITQQSINRAESLFQVEYGDSK